MAKLESDFNTYGELLGGWGLKNSKYTPESNKGVFAEDPAASRKYSGDSETIARLAIPVYDSSTIESTIVRLPKDVQEIARKIFVGPESYTLGYIDFLLQSAQESFSEKVQVVDTLSDNYIAYFFGQNPPVFQYSGLLFNTWQDDWRSAFFLLYEELLRGTKLARRRKFCTLRYDQQIVYGYMINHSQSFSSDTQMAAQFSFSFLVKGVRLYRLPDALPSEPGTLIGSRATMSFLDRGSPVGGLNVSAVKRTLRQVGTPIYVSTTAETSESNNPEEGDYTIPDLEVTPATPEQKQLNENVPNRKSVL